MIEIRAGDLTAGVIPEIGGSLAYFRKGSANLMRPLGDAERARGDVLGVAMFPMIPYANRIADNAFDFDGRSYHFAPNNPPEKFNVHGTGWQLPWRAEKLAEDEAVLTLVHIVPTEPYSYAARQQFKLTADRLSVITEVENRGEWRMPFGFGQHPWFHRDPDVTVAFKAETFWLEGWDNTVSERIKVPPELSFYPKRGLPPARRNNCYGGWDGLLEITWRSRGVRLRVEADPLFRNLMFYADPARPVFCIEPQTNVACAFNLAGALNDDDLGIIVLAPGEKASGTLAFVPSVV